MAERRTRLRRLWRRTAPPPVGPHAPWSEALWALAGRPAAVVVATAAARRAAVFLDAAHTGDPGVQPAAAALDAVATATGAALGGARTTVVLTTSELPAALPALHEAVHRRAALLCLAVPEIAPDWLRAVDPVAVLDGCGALAVAPWTPQEAVDAAVVARMAAEAASLPAVVLVGPASGDDVDLPPDLPALLPPADAARPAPTAGQRLLWGETRRQVPRWLDADAPLGLGALYEPSDALRGAAATATLLDGDVATLVDAAVAAFCTATGRDLSPLGVVAPRRGRPWLLASGAAAGAAADELARATNPAAGLVGLRWLNPVPNAALAAAVGAQPVWVLDSLPGPGGSSGPVAKRHTLATLRRPDAHAYFGAQPAPTGGQLAAFFSLAPRAGAAALWLSPVPLDGAEDCPRRQALGDEIGAVYPALRAQLIAPHVGVRDAPAGAGISAPLPRWVRAHTELDRRPGNLPRFWGEVVEPRRRGADDGRPDPFVAGAWMAPGSAALLPTSGDAAKLPVFDRQACTACGRCWAVCPEGAIGASAGGIDAWLSAAAASAPGDDPAAAAAAQRALKAAVAHLESCLADGQTRLLDRQSWDAAAAAARAKLGGDESMRAAAAARIDALVATAQALPPLSPVDWPAVDTPHAPLVALAIDAERCRDCGLCSAICPAAAVHTVVRSDDIRREARAAWALLDAMPDTPESVLAAAEVAIGPAATTLLTRSAAQSASFAAAGGPGSGGQLAVRHAAARIEAAQQRRVAALLATVASRRRAVAERARDLLGGGLAQAGMAALEQALGTAGGDTVDLGELGARLGATGTTTDVDRQAALALVRTARQLEALDERLRQGPGGFGRARMAVVAAGPELAWLGAFPAHPFAAPLIVAPDAQGCAMALGAARGLGDAHLETVRLLRQAELLAAPTPDFAAQLAALERLRWDDLDDEERAACPRLLVVATAGSPVALAGLDATWSNADAPVLWLVLDDGLPQGSDHPLLAALGAQGCAAAATSIGDLDHLARALDVAVATPRPAWLHVLAPEPAAHGGDAVRAYERASAAVAAGAQPLAIYNGDPAKPFGLRLDVDAADHEPSEATYAPLAWAAADPRTAAHWRPAVADERQADETDWWPRPWPERRQVAPTVAGERGPMVPDAALVRWAEGRMAARRTLEEWCGAATPFAERWRAELRADVTAERAAELDARERELAAANAQLQAQIRDRAADLLRQRLRSLVAARPAPES